MCIGDACTPQNAAQQRKEKTKMKIYGNGKKGVVVLSLFDGISCGQIALARAGVNKAEYIASEIKGIGMQVALSRWDCKDAPKENGFRGTDEIGDVMLVHYDAETGILYRNCGRNALAPEDFALLSEEEKQGFTEVPSGEYIKWDLTEAEKVRSDAEDGQIDMLIGGSPCQDFSAAGAFSGKSKKDVYGLKGLKSRLFYEFLRIKKEIDAGRKAGENPLLFFLENVNMKDDSETNLNTYLNVTGIHMNSKILGFQNRPRIYWTNIVSDAEAKVIQAEVIARAKAEDECPQYDFQDYMDRYDPDNSEENEDIKQAFLTNTPSRQRMWADGKSDRPFSCKNMTEKHKIGCLSRKQDRCPNSGLIAAEPENFGLTRDKFLPCRFITYREVELAQTLPEGYLRDPLQYDQDGNPAGNIRGLSYLQAQDVAGDGWTADAIAEFFRRLPDEFKQDFVPDPRKDYRPAECDGWDLRSKKRR